MLDLQSKFYVGGSTVLMCVSACSRRLNAYYMLSLPKSLPSHFPSCLFQSHPFMHILQALSLPLSK